MIKRNTIFRILNIIAWVVLASLIVVLLVSAVKKEQTVKCSDVVVEFAGSQTFRMLDENEILSALFPETKGRSPKGKPVQQFNLFGLEKQLEKNPWIKQADLFFDQQHILHILVAQRTPVARLFTPAGNSFYMDELFSILPLKSTDMIELPVFTNFYINPAGAEAADTLLMKRVVDLAKFIQADPFWMAQVEEVNINSDKAFELYTQVGDQTVFLGYGSDWKNLFYKLRTLYKSLQTTDGWGKYATIDLQFKDQVVCVRKTDLFKVADSTVVLDTLQLQQNTKIINPEKNKL